MMESLHTCDNLPSAGISVVRSEEYLRDSAWLWKLAIERLAVEDDLENNHHLENIGDTYWTTVLEICNCPYCGVRLKSGVVRGSRGASFVHYDAQSWESRVE